MGALKGREISFLLRGWREPAERRRWGAWNEIYEGPLFQHLEGRLKFKQFINFLRVSVPPLKRQGLKEATPSEKEISLFLPKAAGFLLKLVITCLSSRCGDSRVISDHPVEIMWGYISREAKDWIPFFSLSLASNKGILIRAKKKGKNE